MRSTRCPSLSRLSNVADRVRARSAAPRTRSRHRTGRRRASRASTETSRRRRSGGSLERVNRAWDSFGAGHLALALPVRREKRHSAYDGLAIGHHDTVCGSPVQVERLRRCVLSPLFRRGHRPIPTELTANTERYRVCSGPFNGLGQSSRGEGRVARTRLVAPLPPSLHSLLLSPRVDPTGSLP